MPSRLWVEARLLDLVLIFVITSALAAFQNERPLLQAAPFIEEMKAGHGEDPSISSSPRAP
jgi:hypothetical protein